MEASREAVLECSAELWANDEPDWRESRPPATVSSCSSMLKEGMPDEAAAGTGFRLKEWVRLSALERLDRLVSKELSGRELEASDGMAGRDLVGTGGIASAMAIV